MRTTYPLIILLAVAVMVAVIQGSGFMSAVGAGSGVSDYKIDDKVEDQASGNGYDEGIGGQGRDTGNTPVDFILGFATFLWDIGSLVVMAPYTLTRLLLPWSWSEPLSWIIELLSLIGVYQAITGRRYV
jgi:hypothetical protein